jgi:hypothetical protein
MKQEYDTIKTCEMEQARFGCGSSAAIDYVFRDRGQLIMNEVEPKFFFPWSKQVFQVPFPFGSLVLVGKSFTKSSHT